MILAVHRRRCRPVTHREKERTRVVSRDNNSLARAILLAFADLGIYLPSARERLVLGGGSRSCKLVVAPGTLLKIPSVEVVDQLAK